jgi:hypothetical protein
MREAALLLAFFFPVWLHGQAAQSDPDYAPLDSVVIQVDSALSEYQTHATNDQYKLPPLKTAKFEFKTTTTVTVGGTISLWIITFGASKETDVINDVTFDYGVKAPAPLHNALVPHPKETTVRQQLVQTMEGAANALQTAQCVGKVPFNRSPSICSTP